MAANKSDLFDKEQVPEADARSFASEIGAVFKLTSACTATGIEELFKRIGCKYLEPDYREEDGTSKTGSSNEPVKFDRSKTKED